MMREWQLVAHPTGMPKASDFALRERAEPQLADGMVRVRNSWLSVDPYMRGQMDPGTDGRATIALNAPIAGRAFGEVIETRSDAFAIGDKVLHMLGWRDQAVADASAFRRPPVDGIPDTVFLGLLGMPGLTAYFGLLDVAAAKAGDVVFVSAAAGAVGSAVVQIAKIKGMTVIGSAGGSEKCARLRALGADVAIDYRAPAPLAEKLAKAAPGGINVYFDNVGGDHLDAALAFAKPGSRFAICGMIGSYNDHQAIPMRHLTRIVPARIALRGFVGGDFLSRAAEFRQDMTRWIAEDRIHSVETIFDGLEMMGEAFRALFTGASVGKIIGRV